MPSLIKALFAFASALAISAAAVPARYAVLAEDAGAWPQILESVGFQAAAPGLASILVIRPQTAAQSGWTERVE